MKYALKACVAALAIAAATPAAADIVVYDGVEYGVGDTINIHFEGSAGDQFEGLAADLALTFQSVDASGDYVFAYSIANTSTDPDQASSELSGFGFDVDPNLSSATETGPLTVDSGNISNGVDVEFCLTAGANCNGGSSNGDPIGNGGFDGFFTLLFAGGDPGMITLTDLTTRFQSTGANTEGSGIGTPTDPVPEPATWAMMLMGFGATGYAMRRRRRSAGIPQVA